MQSPYPVTGSQTDTLMIQYIIMSERLFYVQATNQRTATKWQQATGRDLLPVRSSKPSPTPAGCLAYRLDASRLTLNEQMRLAGYLTMRCRMEYREAWRYMVEGVPIAAADCELVQEQESNPAPVFIPWLNRYRVAIMGNLLPVAC